MTSVHMPQFLGQTWPIPMAREVRHKANSYKRTQRERNLDTPTLLSLRLRLGHQEARKSRGNLNRAFGPAVESLGKGFVLALPHPLSPLGVSRGLLQGY